MASWKTGVENGSYVKGDTLEDVINQLGLPVEATLATVNRYNEICDNGVDIDYHKWKEQLIPIQEEPFYGAQIGSPIILTVMGGLRTDINMRVCDEKDQLIEGLFNVGTMVGDYFANCYDFSIAGNNYGANCLTFGYLTGRAIAKGEI